jgi:hypothetical protein
MNANVQKKMCWNCDGNVQLEEDVCPYCQTSLDGFMGGMADGSLLYPSARGQSKVIPAAPFAPQHTEEEESSDEALNHGNENNLLSFTCALALMMGGIILMIFAIALCVFSHNGKLTLQWNSDYWLLYCGMALPLLYLGVRTLQRLEDQGE